jgi:methyl-accepting chemotaxis protein
MINKLGDDLGEAITEVGGDVSGIDNIMDYPEYIKNNLTAGVPGDNILLQEGAGIIIKKNGNGYKIGATSEAKLVEEIKGKNLTIPKLTTIQEALAKIVYSIPAIGDDYIDNSQGSTAIIRTTETGTDTYKTPYTSGEMDGLNADRLYLRICTTKLDSVPTYVDLDDIFAQVQKMVDDVKVDIDIDDIVNQVLTSPLLINMIEQQVKSSIDAVIEKEIKEEIQSEDTQQLIRKAIEEEVAKVETDVTEISNKVDTIETKVEAVEKKIEDEIEEAVSTVSQNITIINNSLEQVEKKVEDANNKVVIIESDIETINTNVETVSQLAKETQTMVSVMSGQLDEFETIIDEIINNVDDEGLTDDEITELF